MPRVKLNGSMCLSSAAGQEENSPPGPAPMKVQQPYSFTPDGKRQADYGPYPAKVSGNRVSDELAPVKLLAPADPIFSFPNRIGPSAWAGWVQERGLYFLGEKDPKYVDLVSMTDSFVSMTDSFKDNPGEKLGAMVRARYGQGNWIYLGLGLWRQLPAGTDGAYQLLANLISLPKAKATESPAREHIGGLARR